MRGSAFQATFGDDEDEHSAADDDETKQSSSKGKRKKRSGSQQDGKDSKRPATQCSGCELKDHKL